MNYEHRTMGGSLAKTLCVAILLGLAPHCWAQAPATRPSAGLSDPLQVNGPVIATVKAEGFQVYTLKRDAAGKLAWALKAPDAKFHGAGGLEGTHYAGPTWELTADHSKVVGKKIAERPSPTADAAPWLLLSAAKHEGTGTFAAVTFIQRVHTTGGKAPAVGDGKEGDETRVPYTAEYVFYGAGATTQPSAP